MLTETLREKLGKSYSPYASSDLSRVWTGYGTFSVTASVNLADVAATRAALAETIAALRDPPGQRRCPPPRPRPDARRF